MERENGLYLSNDMNTVVGYTNNGSGYVGIVRRPIKYGQPTRRAFLEDNDFIFNRPPGIARRYFTTTDEPNYPWLHSSKKRRRKSLTDSPFKDWRGKQDFEVRANAGAEIIGSRNRDKDFRHYIIVGNEGEKPVELIDMFKSTGALGHKGHYGKAGVGFSGKK